MHLNKLKKHVSFFITLCCGVIFLMISYIFFCIDIEMLLQNVVLN